MKSRFISLALVVTLAGQACAPIGFSITTPSGQKPTYAQPNPEESDGELTPVGYALLGVGVTSIALALLLSGGKNPQATADAFDQAAREQKQNEICFVENGCQEGSTAAVGESETASNTESDEALVDEASADEGSDTTGSSASSRGPRRARGSRSSPSADQAGASAAASGDGDESSSDAAAGEAGAKPPAAGAGESEESGSGWQGGSWCAWTLAEQKRTGTRYPPGHCEPEYYRVFNEYPINKPSICVAPDCAERAAARFDELTAVCRANVEKNKYDYFSTCMQKAEKVANDLAKSCRTPCPERPSTGAGKAK